MLATDFIKKYPSACGEAVEWINSLEEGVPAEEAWEICPNGSWLAWAASRVGVPEEERWVWVDLVRLWTADTLDKEGVGHKLRKCSPVVGIDSVHAAAHIAADASSPDSFNSYVIAEIAFFAINYSAESVADFAAHSASAVCSADMIREWVKNPFRGN